MVIHLVLGMLQAELLVPRYLPAFSGLFFDFFLVCARARVTCACIVFVICQ